MKQYALNSVLIVSFTPAPLDNYFVMVPYRIFKDIDTCDCHLQNQLVDYCSLPKL